MSFRRYDLWEWLQSGVAGGCGKMALGVASEWL